MKILIDFDFACYAIACACDGMMWNYRGKQWEHKAVAEKILIAEGKDPKELYQTKDPEPWEKVEKTIVKYVDDFLDSLDNPFDFTLLLSGDKGHFRYEVATIQPYKGNRIQELPYHFKDIKNFIVDTYNAKRVYHVETDDAVGILLQPGDLIVSPDKDLDQFPGNHYNPQSKKHYEVNPSDALSNFYCQCLTGDSSDNIPGLYGIGKSSAYVKQIKDMDSEVEMFDLVAKLYEQRFGSYWKMFLLENCKLLWLIRNANPFTPYYWMGQLMDDYDFYRKDWEGIIFSE